MKTKKLLKKFHLVYFFLLVTTLVFVFKILGILQPLEFFVYDLMFHLNPYEQVDERITIVEWNEECIQQFEESVISDNTLVQVFNKLLSQNPRYIGLDLYRDLPVAAKDLNKDENDLAYKSLSKIFDSNKNIYSIKKTINPYIKGSKILEENDRLTSSDIPVDRDFKIRRAYIYPTVDKDDNPTEVPYFGFLLGYKYLESSGFNSIDPERLIIKNDKKEIEIKPLQKNIFNFFFNDRGEDFYINWRKNKDNKPFKSISILDLLNKNLPDTFFRDQIVIIGNTSSSSSDTHSTPINRWEISNFTYGVEIVAQVTSSIVNAALENRNLINPASLQLEILLAYISTFIVYISGEKLYASNHSSLQFKKKQLLIGTTVILCCAIFLISIFLYKFGIWLNIVPSILASVIYCFLVISYYRREIRKKNYTYLEILLRNFNHNVSNISSSILSSIKNVEQLHNSNIKEIRQENDDAGITPEEFALSKVSINLNDISESINNIQNQLIRIKRYHKQTSNFINYTYNEDKYSNVDKINFNQYISETVRLFDNENPYSYQVNVEEAYDRMIGYQNIYLLSLQIVLENLLDNSYYAVNPANNNFQPKIFISTVNYSKYVQLIVEDNGCGIPKNKQSEVFKPKVSFRSTRSSGTGLYLVDQIVQSWKGSISLESEINAGTKIIINIPKIIA